VYRYAALSVSTAPAADAAAGPDATGRIIKIKSNQKRAEIRTLGNSLTFDVRFVPRTHGSRKSGYLRRLVCLHRRVVRPAHTSAARAEQVE
jgi:hypothetical protein